MFITVGLAEVFYWGRPGFAVEFELDEAFVELPLVVPLVELAGVVAFELVEVLVVVFVLVVLVVVVVVVVVFEVVVVLVLVVLVVLVYL